MGTQAAHDGVDHDGVDRDGVDHGAADRDAGDRDAGDRDSVRAVVAAALAALELTWSEPRPGVFTVTLPGVAKLATECAIEIGRHTVAFRAFVVRAPEHDAERVYRWVLERNLKLDGVAFCVDALGDLYLIGRVSPPAVSAAEVDRLLGAVADAADASFNPLLELGFADSIRAEWAWRRSRGESTANLAAFRSLDPGPAPQLSSSDSSQGGHRGAPQAADETWRTS